jgi:uncharacterized protein YecE (DUF72 family)
MLRRAAMSTRATQATGKRRAADAPETPQPRRTRRRDDDEEEAPQPAYALSGPGARVRIATSGFTLLQARYWKSFDTLELNATFYRTPKPEIWASWAAKRPRSSTQYVVKVHKYLTHSKRLILDDAFRARWALWWGDHCKLLADAGCLLCLLWQLPPAMTATPANRARLRDTLLSPATSPVAAVGVRCAIEFRHSSWHCDEVYAELRNANWCLVTSIQNNAGGWAGDLASGITPPLESQLPVLTCDWGAYIRFHGQLGQYRGCHGDEQMRAWAARIAPLLRDQGRTVIAAFNNTDEDKPPSAVLDAMALGRELRALGLMDA